MREGGFPFSDVPAFKGAARTGPWNRKKTAKLLDRFGCLQRFADFVPIVSAHCRLGLNFHSIVRHRTLAVVSNALVGFNEHI